MVRRYPFSSVRHPTARMIWPVDRFIGAANANAAASTPVAHVGPLALRSIHGTESTSVMACCTSPGLLTAKEARSMGCSLSVSSRAAVITSGRSGSLRAMVDVEMQTAPGARRSAIHSAICGSVNGARPWVAIWSRSDATRFTLGSRKQSAQRQQ